MAPRVARDTGYGIRVELSDVLHHHLEAFSLGDKDMY